MRRQVAGSDRKLRRRLIAGATVLAILLALLRLEGALAPAVRSTCATAVQQSLTALLCRAAEDSLAANEQKSYATILYNPDGSIAALMVSAAAVNALQADLTARASAAISDYTADGISVPVGGASGLTILSGRGPRIRVRLCPVGAVTPALSSSFEEAGINQTIHRLTLTLTAQVRLAAPLQDETVTASYSCLVAETWLVGELPDYLLAGTMIQK